MEVCQGHNCWCQLEWFCEHAGVARVFTEGAVDHIDPYCYCLPFVVRERFARPDAGERLGLVEFVGVVHPVMLSCQYRALRKAMRGAHWGILSTRIKNGVARTVEICRKHNGK